MHKTDRTRLRVFHGLSEVAGQNYYSVKGLNIIGASAKGIVWKPHAFAYPFDESLNIDKSKKFLWPFYAIKLIGFLLDSLRKYDIFHFHYGRSILNNYDLWIYRLLNKKVFFEFHGSDIRDYNKFSKLRPVYSNEGGKLSKRVIRMHKRICKMADGIILHDDELIKYLPETHAPVYIVPLRINLAQFEEKKSDDNNSNGKNIRIVHAPSNRKIKGSKYILDALARLQEKYSNVEVVLVEGKTQEEAREIYRDADIIVDQIIIGTYGVFALEGMALGKPVVTYIDDEMRNALPNNLPIYSADIKNIYERLEQLLLDDDLRQRLGKMGPEYVKNYHDYVKVSRYLLAIYNGEVQPSTGRQAFENVGRICSN